MKIKLSNLENLHKEIEEELNNAITNVIKNSSFIKGSILDEFQNKFASFCDSKFCVGTSSGTSALYLILKCLGIGQGDEVLTVPNTFIATATAISMTGAVPRFADIEEKSYLMDVSKIEEKITPKTKAIIPVHLYGQTVDMDPLIEIAQKYNLKIIEDCCQAHGAEYKGKKVPIHESGCFSFFPAKNLGAIGDAGCVVTNDENLTNQISLFVDHGREKGEKHKHKTIGFNFRMDTLQAAVLNVKLKYLNKWTEQKRENAKYYDSLLKNKFQIPTEKESNKHVYHIYQILAENRDELQKFLSEKGIQTGIHYKIPLHLQPAYEFLGYKQGDFPVAENYAKKALSLPISSNLTKEEIDCIVREINNYFSHSATAVIS